MNLSKNKTMKTTLTMILIIAMATVVLMMPNLQTANAAVSKIHKLHLRFSR